MVDSQVLKIVLKMVDEASKVAEKVDKNIQKISDTSKKTSNTTQTSSKIIQNALRQQEQSTNKLAQAYNKLNTTVQNVFNKIKNTIKNSKPAQYIKESSLAQPFLNAAEKIRSTWQTKMQQVKNITSSLSSNLTPSFNRISNTASNTATRISNVFTNAKGKITQAFNEIQKGYNYGYNPLRMVVDTSQARNSISSFFAQANALEASKVATSRSRWGQIGSTISSTFTKLKTSAGGAYNKLIRINNAIGPLGSAIAGAFGAIGVSSISQFTIGAAMAREKINSVTTSITGSKQATKELGETIKSATAGGVVGFNNTAQALNQVAIKFHMNTNQMKAAAPAIANIGNLSVAMGHSQEQAANMMAHAYDGLNGNFKTLRQNLGVTKNQLMQAGWSGAADDVDGYTDALNRVLEKSPKLQEYYNSTEGRITRAKMAIQAVGREIGETLLPIISKVLKAFLDFNKKNPEITKAFLYLGLAIMGLSSISMVILPIVELARVLKIAAAAQWLLNAAMDANPIGIIIIAIAVLIAYLAYLYFNHEEVRKAMNDFAAFIYGGLSSAWDYLCGCVNNTVQAFNNFCNWIWNLPGNIYLALQGIIQSIILWAIALGQQAWTAGSQFVTNLINWIMQLPTQVWIWLVNTLTNIYLWVSQLVISAIQAGSQFVNNYINFMRTLPTRVWSWLLNTINRVKTWAIQMKTQAQQTAQGFINRFVSFIKSLPIRAWLYLNYTIQRAKTFKNLIIAVIQQTASRMVQSFCNKIRKLPSEMWNELMRIKDQILRGIGPLGSAIKSLGSNLLKKFKDALGIHSPGHMFYAIYDEMGRIANNLIKNKNTLGKEAKNLGQSMIKGFDKNNFEQMNDIFMQATDSLKMPEIDMNNVQTATQETLVSQKTIFQQQTSTQQQEPVDNTNPLQNTTIQLPTTQMNTDATQITNAFTNMATMINPQIMSIANILNTLSTTSTQNKTTLLQNNTQTMLSLQNLTNTSTLSMQKTIQNNNTTIQSYKTLHNKINTMLQNIQTKNTQSWTHIKTTTQNNLKSMLTSTRSVTSQMVSAWNSMKNSIISAAESIRSQSTNRFNRLWSTIKTFYNRIRNPGGAGPANRASNSRVKRNRATGSIGSTVRNSLNNAIKPRRNRISASKIKPLIPQMDMEYILPFGTSSLPTQDLIKYMTNPNLGAGWNNIIQPNTSWIRKKSNEWKMNGPKVFGKYPTGNNLFKVKEFENGTPRISYGTFKTMAENVFRNIHYDFYWNSEKYGNWRAAAMSGGMNCDDSTEFLMALARACGLSARKVHGHWNNLGHYWAEIEGHKMDTTGFMLGKGWTPSQSHAGPAPSSWKMFESDNTDKSDTIIHGGSIDFNLNINVDTNGNVDSEVIKQGVQVALSDNEILKQIATSSKFQDYDNKTKIRLNRSIERKG